MRFSQVRILTDDPRRSHRFYRDVIGFAPAFGGEGDAYSSFRAGSATVAVFLRAGQAEVVTLRGGGDGALLVLEVDDLAAEARRLAAAGAVLEGPVRERPDWGIRVLHLRDPDGNLLEVVENLPEGPGS